jgi:catechol 2,3-dioxygenase-like lactoylglutathione lyase family enzyme
MDVGAPRIALRERLCHNAAAGASRFAPAVKGDTTMITGLDHVQLAMPRGGEGRARAFYGDLLGMAELEKPAPLAARGGCWFAAGGAQIHIGVEDPFTPARKAHPALLVDDLDGLVARLRAAGADVLEDSAGLDRRRFYAADPFGNRLELIARGDGFSER